MKLVVNAVNVYQCGCASKSYPVDRFRKWGERVSALEVVTQNPLDWPKGWGMLKCNDCNQLIQIVREER